MKVRKLLPFVIIGITCLGSIFSVYGRVLHENNKAQQVAQGATHISSQRLTENGWQDIHILEVDLNSSNIKLAPIGSSTLGERQTLLEMARNQGAIAAVNADFFDMATAISPSFGPVIEDGVLKHAYNNAFSTLGPAMNMATFVLDTNNNALMDFYSVMLRIEQNGLKLFDLGTYNKLGSALGRPAIVDKSYYPDTSSIVSKYQAQGVHTVLIKDGAVLYVSSANEVVSLQYADYGIVMNTAHASQYLHSLYYGALVELKQEIQLNSAVIQEIQNLQMGIGGGGLIMKNGVPYQGATHQVSPNSREPRTVLATTNVGSLLLITIDGRNNTLGANHVDLVSLLTSYGVKDAMYLDGGGSTTFVAREEALQEVKVQNNPSDGSLRRVSNGIGIFSTVETGPLARLYLEPVRERTFVGEGVRFTIKGSDALGNPVTNLQGVKLSVAGVEGYWQDTVFYPQTAGSALLIAEKEGVEVATQLQVTSGPVALRVEPSYFQVDENASKTVQVYGIDVSGYKIPLTNGITWESTSINVIGQGNTITAKQKETALLKAKYKGLSTEVGVVVGNTIVAVESFEELAAKWGGDTTTVQGKVEPSKEIKYHGNQSIKMTYTFEADANKQVAYTIFNTPITIPQDANAVNLWVYARAQKDTLKIEVQDAKGQVHYLKLADSLDHEGWKYLTATLPSNIALPAKVTKLYTYATGNNTKRTSAIYFDHLSITRGLQQRQGITIRNDHLFDQMYKDSLQPSVGNQYDIHIMGQTKMNSMMVSKVAREQMATKLQGNNTEVVLASQANISIPFAKNPHIYTNTYQSFEKMDTKVIFVPTDAGGIRKSEALAWIKVKEELESTTAKHVILVMSKNPLTQFDDTREGKAFHDYLVSYRKASGRDVFVVTTGGYQKEVRIEDGIRYIRVNGLMVESDDPRDGEYVRFKVVNGQIYYTFEYVM